MIKKYSSHIVFSFDKYWISIDKTGVMTWNGKRNHFYMFRKPSTRKSRFFKN